MRLETREVLAGAYAGRNGAKKGTQSLTHAVLIDANGKHGAGLCGRARTDSLADPYASDPALPPTCSRCRARWDQTLRPSFHGQRDPQTPAEWDALARYLGAKDGEALREQIALANEAEEQELRK